jgi:branched-chain amino acid transport system ATP-binding protein
VAQGETVGIIGPNGSGKTTLFNCLSGFNRVPHGVIHFRGEDISGLGPSQRALKGVGRVFQNPGIFREMSLLENMITALEGRQPLLSTFFPWSSAHSRNKTEALRFLAEVGLEQKSGHKASSLSGGQMRLLEITRTLAFGAELFLLDEPTAGVSPKMKEEVALLVEQLRKLGKTVLVIEHDIQFIQRFCDRIIVLDVGQVVMDGDPKSVRENPRLQEIYFGGAHGH